MISLYAQWSLMREIDDGSEFQGSAFSSISFLFGAANRLLRLMLESGVLHTLQAT